MRAYAHDRGSVSGSEIVRAIRYGRFSRARKGDVIIRERGRKSVILASIPYDALVRLLNEGYSVEGIKVIRVVDKPSVAVVTATLTLRKVGGERYEDDEIRVGDAVFKRRKKVTIIDKVTLPSMRRVVSRVEEVVSTDNDYLRRIRNAEAELWDRLKKVDDEIRDLMRKKAELEAQVMVHGGCGGILERLEGNKLKCSKCGAEGRLVSVPIARERDTGDMFLPKEYVVVEGIDDGAEIKPRYVAEHREAEYREILKRINELEQEEKKLKEETRKKIRALAVDLARKMGLRLVSVHKDPYVIKYVFSDGSVLSEYPADKLAYITKYGSILRNFDEKTAFKIADLLSS